MGTISIAIMLIAIILLTTENYRGICQAKVVSMKTFKRYYKHQVSIRVRGEHVCAGALIGLQHVLTAAFCCYDEKTFCRREPETMQIIGGYYKLVDGCTTVANDVVGFVVHEEYDYTWRANNIAILKLRYAFSLKLKKIQTIQLTLLVPDSGTKGVVAGWRFEKKDGNTTKNINVLQAMWEPIYTDDECKQLTNRSMIGEMCTKTTLCKGDYGGPLTYKNKLIGITSYRRCGEYQGFIKTKHYLNWIVKAIQSGTTCHTNTTKLIVYCLILIAYRI